MGTAMAPPGQETGPAPLPPGWGGMFPEPGGPEEVSPLISTSLNRESQLIRPTSPSNTESK